MAEPDDPKLVAVRVFAAWTELAARTLDCSYADAAVFLTKLQPFFALLRDADFQAKLARFGAMHQPATAENQPTPQGKAVH